MCLGFKKISSYHISPVIHCSQYFSLSYILLNFSKWHRYLFPSVSNSSGCSYDLYGGWVWSHKRRKQQHLLPWQLCKDIITCIEIFTSVELWIFWESTVPFCCRPTTLGGIRWRNLQVISSDFAALWTSSASECQLLEARLLLCRFWTHFLVWIFEANASPLAWMTSQQQSVCNGMVMFLGNQIGQKRADSFLFHWFVLCFNFYCFILSFLVHWVKSDLKNFWKLVPCLFG